jgi:hypothetical protein
MELTQEQIEKINKLAPSYWRENEQGVFVQPSGIPVDVKGHVIYMRWHTGGVSGGSCWESSNPERYETGHKRPKFEVLDLVLKELMPSISYLQFREIEDLIHTDSETDREYYGNCTDYDIEYIVLSELIEALEGFTS